MHPRVPRDRIRRTGHGTCDQRSGRALLIIALWRYLVTGHHTVNTTYEPFSLEPAYIDANRAFVQQGGLQGRARLLDLACGTGTVSELVLECAPDAHLNGLDLDPQQVELS